jgi:hypothetical protein
VNLLLVKRKLWIASFRSTETKPKILKSVLKKFLCISLQVYTPTGDRWQEQRLPLVLLVDICLLSHQKRRNTKSSYASACQHLWYF